MAAQTEIVSIDALIDRAFVRYKGDVDEITNLINLVFAQSIGRDIVEDRIKAIESYQRQLKHLREHPVLEQRTPAWYEARNTMITASDFAQALGCGKFGTQKQFFQKKCGYEDIPFDGFGAALKWGVKYEAVAVDAYAAKNGMVMHEFGLLRHPEKDWVGASPDAINDLGVMVEIKCPFKRKITGEVPTQYYYQMQGQLDVCGLRECDYLECEFLEYDGQEDFCRHFSDNMNPKGIIIEKEGGGFEYSHFGAPLPDLLEWLSARPKGIKTYFWQLHKYNVVRVYRDDSLLQDKIYAPLKEVWDRLVAYKADKALYDSEIGNAKAAKAPQPAKQIFTIETTSSKSSTTKPEKGQTNNGVFSGYAFLDDDA